MSTLGIVLGGQPDDQVSQPAQAAPQPAQATNAPTGNTSPPPPSRLGQIMSAVAKATAVGLSSLPPGQNTVSALGAGVRAGNASIDQQNEIHYKDLDTQMRLVQLHNDSIRIQNQNQAQQDAHQSAENTQRDYDDEHNIEYNPHPSVGDAAIQTLKARSQVDPTGASIAPGTFHSADGNTLMEPDGSAATNAGLTQKYAELQGVLNLPAMQPGSKYVSGKNLDMMGKVLKGNDIGGKPLSKDMLQNYLAGRDAQRAELVKTASPFALETFDNLTSIYKADLKNHQDFEDQASAKAAQQAGAKKQQEKQGEINAEMSPQGRALAKANLADKIAGQDNAASDKPQKAQNTDSNGNPVWVAGVTSMEKNKATLSENMVQNANDIASIVLRRPDLVGAIAGRYTSGQQMIGNNDPDISAIGAAVHNFAMANNGIHGQKGEGLVEKSENLILNNFKNGPNAILSSLHESSKSVQTFIDAARPNTYKSHSKNGGAMRAMVSQ